MPYTMEDFRRDVARELLEEFSSEERMRGLSPEERMRGLSIEDRLRGLSVEVIRAYVEMMERQGEAGSQP